MIEGSSEKEIPKDETLNEFYVKNGEPKDVEYDDNVIEMKSEASKVIPDKPKDGQIRISDMTKEQLQNAVVNLMNVQKQLETTLREYEARAKRIQQIWNSKADVRARYFMLRDNPKAKGVKVV